MKHNKICTGIISLFLLFSTAPIIDAIYNNQYCSTDIAVKAVNTKSDTNVLGENKAGLFLKINKDCDIDIHGFAYYVPIKILIAGYHRYFILYWEVNDGDALINGLSGVQQGSVDFENFIPLKGWLIFYEGNTFASKIDDSGYSYIEVKGHASVSISNVPYNT